MTLEKKLIRHIQKTYPIKWGRPVLNHNQTLLVSFAITLNQILELVMNLNLKIKYYNQKDISLKRMQIAKV